MMLREHRGVWKTNQVVVELQTQGTDVILERTRGYKQKKKSVFLQRRYLNDLNVGILTAILQQPQYQLRDQVIVGMVDSGYGVITIKWTPYWFGRANALMIDGGRGRCIAIEQQDTASFAAWFCKQILALHNSDDLDDLDLAE